MKGKMISSFAAAALALSMVATSAQAASFTVDTLIGKIDSDQSGVNYEKQQLLNVCNCDLTTSWVTNVNTFTVQDAGAGINFIDIAPSTTGYFLLKFGNPGSNDMFFFKNIGELDKLVWTDTQLLGAGLLPKHLDSLSHYATVPEPASLLLLGAGLAGIGIWRRKFSKG